jgi:hypothetical protein
VALAVLLGAVGAERIYLGQKTWWLPLSATALTLPLLAGISNWYESPAFFVLMVPVLAGFLHALVLALKSDERFDVLFNAGAERRNSSGWGIVLLIIGTMMSGATLLMATLALLFQMVLQGSAS